jgi:hypothetical protein
MHQCGKRRFKSLEQAIERRAELEDSAQTLRAYYCEACGGWHFSSQSISSRRNFLQTKRKKK